MDLVSILLQSAPSLIQIFKKEDKPTLGFKHLILKNDDHVKSLLNRDFSFLDDLVSKKVFLIENEVFNFGQQYFRRAIQKEYHESWEASPFNDLAKKDKEKFTKRYELDDLDKIIYQDDNEISGNIINELKAKDNSFKPEDFAHHQVYDFHCHGNVHEVKEFRQMWLVLLWIENLSQDPIPLKSIMGTFYENNQEVDYRPLYDKHGISKEREYPSNQVQPGENILLPEYFLLPPLRSDKKNETQKIQGVHWENAGKSYNYAALNIKDSSDYHLIGPSFKPKKIKTKDDIIKVHDLDLNNLITINEHLNFGSCPYVFGCKPNNEIDYLGDILTNNYAKIYIEKYSKVFICELEKETTVIKKILGDGELLLSDKILKKDDTLMLPNLEHNINCIEIYGYYIAKRPYVDTISNFTYKHNLIMNQIYKLPT